ncbi:acyl-coenzyme A diphosphatase NUDT19 isoform X2 [Zeugodacus cucurbitae]|uniref:Nucleoside diphosphate-linked moiety X motif 19, mitochondrial n=2 Tax=Zeugodacus cucurbitae TaxID=28588 RepID=A0A0A1XLV1_ZEUCU|nr:acyl-coenzyme A diphosphatase NUDT19 isoform X2 [Zeugodacus cucurbitae]
MSKITMASKVATKWRESASLIILAKNQNIKDFGCDYRVLLFKRAEKSSFFPNSAVFPGGVHETSDASPSWLNYIKSFSQSTDPNIFRCNFPRPAVFTNNDRGQMQREFSMRITALRETFEETGILLCRKRLSTRNKLCSNYSHSFEDFDRAYWQNRVHNDHTQFFTLCKELDVVPDLWSLFEWAAWLTPITFKKRFETGFYLVAVEDTPGVILESNEAANFSWKTPMEFIRDYFNKELYLPPPQLYELSRLLNFSRLDELINFARVRSSKGISLMLPVIQKCADGTVSLMPGDDLYNNNIEETNKVNAETITIEQFRSDVKNLHRVEYFKNGSVFIQHNCSLTDGHLPPVKGIFH